MRQDMAKVIVERPRFGSRLPSKKKGYRKALQAVSMEDRPRCEPMPGRRGGRQRFLNEHLGPMRRFLRSNIGRPWNKVHQELCEYVSFDNAVQAHVLSHVFDYVILHVEVQQGNIVRRIGSWRGYALRPGNMYVCPETGLLRQVRQSRSEQPITKFHQGPTLVYLRRDGAWWEVRLRECPADPEELWDVWFEQDVARIDSQERLLTFGGNLIATSKRPLSPDETREFQRRIRTVARRSTG